MFRYVFGLSQVVAACLTFWVYVLWFLAVMLEHVFAFNPLSVVGLAFGFVAW